MVKVNIKTEYLKISRFTSTKSNNLYGYYPVFVEQVAF